MFTGRDQARPTGLAAAALPRASSTDESRIIPMMKNAPTRKNRGALAAGQPRKQAEDHRAGESQRLAGHSEKSEKLRGVLFRREERDQAPRDRLARSHPDADQPGDHIETSLGFGQISKTTAASQTLSEINIVRFCPMRSAMNPKANAPWRPPR